MRNLWARKALSLFLAILMVVGGAPLTALADASLGESGDEALGQSESIGLSGFTRFMAALSPEADGQLVVGLRYYAMILGDGSLWVQGLLNEVEYAIPTRIADGVKKAAANRRMNALFFIKKDGSLWAVGDNNRGQAGIGSADSSVAVTRVMDGVSDVQAGPTYAMAIKTNGELWAWGYNGYGQLGTGNYSMQRSPVRVMADVASVSAGDEHVLAVDTNGVLWGWGLNSDGQVLSGQNRNVVTPVKVMENVAWAQASNYDSAVIRTNGELWAWGENHSGIVGNGTTNAQSTPVKVLSNVTAATLYGNSMMAITADNVLWAWGRQFGTANYNDYATTPEKKVDNAASVFLDTGHVIVIRNDGSLWGWGNSYYGELGYDKEYTITDPAPLPIAEGLAAKAVIELDGTVVAQLTDGSYWTWTKEDDKVQLKELLNPGYKVEFDPTGPYSFRSLAEGYQKADTLTARITSIGARPLQNLKVTVEGQNPAAFAVDATQVPGSMEYGGSATLTVTPVTGLTTGVHKAAITVRADQLVATLEIAVEVHTRDHTYNTLVAEQFFSASVGTASEGLGNSVSTSWATPGVKKDFVANGKFHVAYEGSGKVQIAVFDEAMKLEKTLSLSKPMAGFGAATGDENGNIYVMYAKGVGEDGRNTPNVTLVKYDADGEVLAQKQYTPEELKNGGHYGDSFAPMDPLAHSNASMAVNGDVIAVHTGKRMFRSPNDGLNHQASLVFYADIDTLDLNNWGEPYTSHSFDQQVIATSDGEFLHVDHGDAYPRGFEVSKTVDGNAKSYTTFHFRSLDHYNSTAAILGGVAELEDSYVLVASSDKVLSASTVKSNQAGSRNVFVQFLKKDFYNYSDEDVYAVDGESRVADGPGGQYLSAGTTDYGVVWLTDYSSSEHALKPKVVSLNDDRLLVMWEVHRSSYNGTYYMIVERDGTVLKAATRLLGSPRLDAYDRPVYMDGVVCWSQTTSKGIKVYQFDVDTAYVTIAATADGNGTVSGGGIYSAGDSVTLTASGSSFSGWYENGSKVSDSSDYLFTADENRQLEARFAAIRDPGNNTGNTGNTGSTGRTGGSGGGGGGGGGSGGGAAAAAKVVINNNVAITRVKSAIRVAKTKGKTVGSVTFSDVTDVPVQSMKAIADAAKLAGGSAWLSFKNETADKKRYVYLSFDPAKGTKDIVTTASLTDARVANIQKAFEKLFKQKVVVISLKQPTDFGMTVRVTTNVDLSKLDLKKPLYFYAYNKKLNKYEQIKTPNYSIKNGKLVFDTWRSGEIIITNRAPK
ncbi:hypothetical protein LJC63_10735 [Ruminococcaceae bacterium OttesenSCG-928-L11]|nr:hypothetical protein [Ruminococcaceae bacterium OttesenSCG-928-L11]